VELGALANKLDTAYRRTAAGLPDNSAVTIVEKNGKARLKLSPLDRLDEPATLVELRRAVGALLPRVDLPEVVLEVARWTGFAEEFTHVSEAGSRAEDLVTSICAVLVAEACNVGLEPMVRQDVPALRRGRLAWVAQNYLRAETLARANARLVAYHSELPLARIWGGGEVASVDGLRFVVPVPSVHAGRNPKYYGLAGRGVTYLNYVSDQFSGFHAIVVPGTLRDSMFILDGLLEQQTVLDPTEVMADTASYSDWVFGLFFLLGYQFSPRLADLGEARFWRIDPRADYGALNALGRHRLNTELVAANWEDLLRVAGSLATGKLKPSEFLRTLRGVSRSATLAGALAELGRIPKTLYLLELIGSPTCRRHILVQLNRQEARHRLARRLFHGHRGQLRQGYREGQEDQLGALGLVLNILVLWTTRYLEAALDQLDRTGHSIDTKDVERLSPLKFRNVNLHGRYSFMLSEDVARGALRPLRDGREPDEDDLDA
jgi:TnpA family transposase